MRRIIALLLLFFMGFGCLEEHSFPGNKTEQMVSLNAVDLDSDGNVDYSVYDYAPFQVNGMEVQRQVTVSVRTSAVYTSYNPTLTDVNLLQADQSLEEFSKARAQADMECGNRLGISNVVCSNTPTCKELCSAASLKCKKIAMYYEEALSDSILSYIKNNNDMRTLIMNTRKSVLTLRLSGDQSRNAFLQDTRDIVYSIADANANPVYTNQNFDLCDKSDFGVGYVLEAAKKIGNYETKNEEYTYRVIISFIPTQAVTDDLTLSGVGMVDRMPAQAIPHPEVISSRQGIIANQNGQDVFISWDSSKSSKEGYVLMYTFTSTTPPETTLAALKVPGVKTKKISLIILGPTNFVLLTLTDLLKNYYIAYGLALGFTLAALFFLYTILILVFTLVNEKAGGSTFLTGFRKAFGRTDIRWRTDMVVAVVLLGVGYYIASVMTAPPQMILGILESIDFLLRNDMGMISITLVFMGSVMSYLAVENFVKIIILERAYGMVIRQEKDLYLAKASTLKDRIKELGKLIDEDTKEDFDVSKEYDVYSSVKLERVDELAKDMNARNRALIEEQLIHVESAISTLSERKKVADENWTKWKENIAKLLEEQEEVYSSSLVTVPASLRAWALSRYVKEASAEGVYFERDALKKRKVSPTQLVQEMIEKRLINGAVVLKQDKVLVSEFDEHGGTLQTALTLKLRTYLNSLAKNLGQHPPQSFAAIGDKNVIVIMKDYSTEAVLFLNKDKFKDAVEHWRAKIKVFETG
ncbi:Uncharacterised protein [Candidatus Bilamarchaeum dharawalense]|uniref:Uncharacterized protein n=1 Tax=Candidatus Bilamarchaeum dharawalense TaxID=2885759 RepID=A0A5E4LQN0_9ARCH|nr:Uncharacterised protein [Candidatus Bilamarchaeum dharawalense]